MSTMTLLLPTTARGTADLSAPTPPARSDKPSKARDRASTQDTQASDKPADTRFDRALQQAREDEPQAERAGESAQGSGDVTVDAAASTPAAPAIDTAQAALWIGAALPQVAAEAALTGAATENATGGKADGATADAQALADLVEGGTASPLPLPLGLAMTTLTTPRTPATATALPATTPQAQAANVLADAGPADRPAATPTTQSSASSSLPATNTAAPVVEQRPAVSSITLATQPAWAAVMADTTQASANTSNTTLSLPAATPTQWREPLLNALGERVQWQLQRGQEQAVIRLEPPNLGRVEIHIRHEAGGLQVHLNATHRDVVQQLQGVSDQLRSELSLRHAGDVAVAVADQGRDADARQRDRGQGGEQAQDPGRALNEGESTSQPRSAFTLAGNTVDKA
jgi:flagellar hook-length control protein FliK